MAGAVERVRPKMMTVLAIMAGLLPINLGQVAACRVRIVGDPSAFRVGHQRKFLLRV
jgi:hypothetical protein